MRLATTALLASSFVYGDIACDVDKNGRIDATDLQLVQLAVGTNDMTRDVNHDGVVDSADLVVMAIGTLTGLCLESNVVLNGLIGAGGTVSASGNEVPMGLVNGMNVTFTLVHEPKPANLLQLYRNGVRMTLGLDYTLAGNTITFIVEQTPQMLDNLVADYNY